MICDQLNSVGQGSVPGELRREDWHVETLYAAADLGKCLDHVVATLSMAGWLAKEIFGIRLALEEAIVNAIKHGHQGDLTKPVLVWYSIDAGKILVEVEDQGPGFNLQQVLDPLAPENLERSSGRGLLLMRHYMTWLRHNESGNRVYLCRHRAFATDEGGQRNRY
jgi:serine/threonine-protein kinase RsbW